MPNIGPDVTNRGRIEDNATVTGFAYVTGLVADDAQVSDDARVEGAVLGRAQVMDASVVTGVVGGDAWVEGHSHIAGEVYGSANVRNATVPEGIQVYAGEVTWDLTVPTLCGTFLGYAWVISNGILNFGCETRPVEEWERRLEELCRAHEPKRADLFIAHIRHIINLYHAAR